jgi:hypothetical protein
MSPLLRTLLTTAVVATPLLVVSAPAGAASSYDACTGFITSLPATIGTQGVWCMNKDLNTPMASGYAIDITVNNVTIDCNGFKLGGLQAGLGTDTLGIHANGRSNIGVRDCNVRGFLSGVNLEGSSGSGHRIERNRFEANTANGISVVGDGSLIRDNLVIDTGGTDSGPTWISGIATSGRVDVIDNQILTVDAAGSFNEQAVGIFVFNATGVVIARNRISGLVIPVEGQAIGLGVGSGTVMDIRDNSFASDVEGPSVTCTTSGQILHGNALLMGEVIGPCNDGGDNYGYGFPL